MLKLRQVPEVYIGGLTSLKSLEIRSFEGSDGRLYDDRDMDWLKSEYGEPTSRKTKYGVTYYFKRKEA